MYADDLVILAPSVAGLSKLLRICESFGHGEYNGIIFNQKKSASLYFISKMVKGAHLPNVYLNGVLVEHGSTTETFPIGKRVRQGCILSPHLFSLYTESVMREAEIQDLGYNIGGRNISNARYADDTALIAQSPMEMQQLLDKVNAAGAKKASQTKTKKKPMFLNKLTRLLNLVAVTSNAAIIKFVGLYIHTYIHTYIHIHIHILFGFSRLFAF